MLLRRTRCKENDRPDMDCSTKQRPIENHGVSFRDFRGCVMSDIGCAHEKNEDNFLFAGEINETCSDRRTASASEAGHPGKWYLAGVFDGISRGGNAEAASMESAKAFQVIAPSLKQGQTKENAERMIRDAFLNAGSAVNRLQRTGSLPGSTGTILCTDLKVFKVFHLGDSRAYLFRNCQLHQLTRDQTLAQLKLDAGLCDKQDPAMEADSHILTDYIGRSPNGYPVESRWIPVQENDVVLLCSDGLYDMCSDSEIEKILREAHSAEKQTQQMVDMALHKGGVDNITCIVIHFTK